MNAQVSLSGLSDWELVSQLESLCQVERRVGAAIIAHLCEVERRRLHLDAGYSSLYTYCVEKLELSEEVAYKRMQAARVAARHPEVLGHLEAGDLSLSSLVVLAPHLDGHGDLVDAALGKSKREVKRLVAESLDPDPVAEPAKLEPIAGGRVRLDVVLSEETARRIQQVVDIDRHLDPACDVATLLDRALAQYLKIRRKEKLAETSRAPMNTRSEHSSKPPQSKRVLRRGKA